jgi:2-polyprenyl-3-methyl-5-hydroxy-6-metoxy-1,4-benzoquinol methylase
VRPAANVERVTAMFGRRAADIRHLDFGGGNGMLSEGLRGRGFNSQSYDPFVDGELNAEQLGRFDLITAFEVFEHVPDVQALMRTLTNLRAADGLVLFTTQLSDGNITRHQRLTWWYAAPRNGHISLFSRASLMQLSRQFSLQLASMNSGVHAFLNTPPEWARHLFR